LNYKVCAGFEILEKESVTGPLASSPRQPIAPCPAPCARGSAAVAWSPPATPPPRAGGPSAVGHALDTGSHRPHVHHPPPEDTPILSSLRPNPFCCPLLAVERHAKLPASLLFVQRNTVFAAQPSMSNGGEQVPGLRVRACFDFPTQWPSSRCRASNAQSNREADAAPFPPLAPQRRQPLPAALRARRHRHELCLVHAHLVGPPIHADSHQAAPVIGALLDRRTPPWWSHPVSFFRPAAPKT
jgi:hypothetical protein